MPDAPASDVPSLDGVFVHLRVHSAYSLSESAIKTKDLIKLAAKNEMPAVAVTDTGNLFGALEFSLGAKDAGIQPIIGCQLAIRRTDGATRPGQVLPPDQIVLLAQDAAGYENMLALVSRSFLDTPSHELPQVSFELLTQHSAGLIALSGGPAGQVGRLLGDGQSDAAGEAARALADAFPGRFYIEIQRHDLGSEDLIEPGLIDIAYAQGLPLVATNDVHFATQDMYEAHDVLLCIAQGATISRDDRRRLTDQHYFKSAKEMATLFADLPEAILNTRVIAERCAYMAPTRKPILPAFPTAQGRDEVAELRAMSEEGLEKRLLQVLSPDLTPEAREEQAKIYRDRLEFELSVIIKMGFPGYFLIVADFIQWAKAHDIPVGPGRGSGAGSVVAWALTITDLDPIRFGLLFERFLNPERVSMPDFDVDFCQDRRDEVIRYVQDKYGFDRVAQIITYGKLQARAVLRDTGRVLEMPYGQVDRLCKLVPNNPANPVTLQEAIDSEPLLRAMREEDENVDRLIGIALKLEGLYRNASTHAAGVVIGDRPLEQLVPLYRDPRSDMPVTQFNMKYVEMAGLVKFDFLGLKTLTVLQRAVLLLRKRGIELDLATVPLDDPGTYVMLSKGDATGVFQMESAGMRDVLRKLKPDRFEDLIAVVALYRPGPMENIPSYIARKHGTETPDYLHPVLEGMLKETFGIMIYQEQVMQAAQLLAGYSLGGADLLRRAMGKKIKAEMEAQRDLFVKGAAEKGVNAKTAGGIFDQIEKFAGYGFNKSHAAAYALVAYHTAYLKANYPVEFFAASMTLDLGNTDKLNVFRQELVRIGVPLLPPDINKSEAEFAVEVITPEKSAVRYALAAVRNVGDQAMRALVREREANGPFRDLANFTKRLDHKAVNKRQLENLVAAGAFDTLNDNRAQTSAAVETMLRQAGTAAEEKAQGLVGLFGDAPEMAALPLPPVLDWLPSERLQREFDAIGFYLSAHPLDGYGKVLGRLGVITQAELVRRQGGMESQRVKLAGIVLGRRERTTGRGTRYAFVALSDASGAYEVTMFAEALAVSRELLVAGKAVLLTVEARAEGEGVRMICNSVGSLEEAAADAAAGLRIFLSDPTPLPNLQKLLTSDQARQRGRGRVSLVVDVEEQEVEIVLPGGYLVTPELRGMVKQVRGVAEVMEL